MRGLFIKDFCILKTQKGFMAILFLISAVFGVLNKNLYFMAGYMAGMTGILAAGTIAYDESEKGLSFLFTLPVSKRTYVREKYLFSFLIVLAAILLIGVTGCLMSVIGSEELSVGEILECCGGSFIGVWMFVMFMLPIKLRFAGEKGRLVLPAVLLVVGAGGVAVVKIAGMFSIDLPGMVANVLSGMKSAQLLTVVAAMSLIATVLSYLCSIRIMERKEF